MAKNLKHPVYKFISSKNLKPGDWMYNCNQPRCGWFSNNLHTLLEHLNERHDVEYLKYEYREVLDQCCGHLMPSKIFNIQHLLNHVYAYKKKDPKIWDKKWDEDKKFLDQLFARIRKEQQLISRYLRKKHRDFAAKDNNDESSPKTVKLNE